VYDTPLTEYLNGWASVVERGVLANHLLVAKSEKTQNFTLISTLKTK